MKVKKIIIMGLIALSSTGLLGCSNTESEEYKADDVSNSNSIYTYKSEEFMSNDYPMFSTEYVDNETGVHYLIVNMLSNGVSITPMYNADGTLKVTK